MDDQEEVAFKRRVKLTENRLQRILGPQENYIMSIQSVLVWENALFSAGILLVVTVLFWLATTLRVFYLIGVVGVIVVFLDMWLNYIWPEIRVPPSPDEDSEGWTSIHPHLLSVPEICNHLANILVRIEKFFESAYRMRQRSHAKFFVYSVVILSCLGVFGCYISGIRLAYLTVLAIMLGPAAFYHNVPQRVLAHTQPYVDDFEQKLNIKRKRAKGKRGKIKGGMESSRDSSSMMADSDDSDEDLAPFVPTDVPLVASRPVPTEDSSSLNLPDSDDDNTGHTPERMTPLSLQQSSEHSDNIPDTDEDEQSMASMSQFLPLVNDMPSQNSLDSLSLAPSEIIMPSLEEDTKEDSESSSTASIKFVPSHFKESSEEEEATKVEPTKEEHLAEGLVFPDVDEDLMDGSSAQDPDLSVALDNPMVAQTVSSLMSSTMAGISALRSTVSTALKQTTEGEYSPEDEASLREQMAEAVEEETHPEERPPDSPATLDEFEFLSQEDLSEAEKEG